MPEVGLFSAEKPLKSSYTVRIRYAVEVEGLPVYSETYDVDTLRQELKADPEAAAEAWLRRLKAPCEARDKPHFAACLTTLIATGTTRGVEDA